MALFLNEVLYKSIREEEANAQLFDFLFHSIQWLDAVSYTHLRAHETVLDLVCRLLLEKKTY